MCSASRSGAVCIVCVATVATVPAIRIYAICMHSKWMQKCPTARPESTSMADACHWPRFGHPEYMHNAMPNNTSRREHKERRENGERSERATSFVLVIHAVTGSFWQCPSARFNARRRHRFERTLIVMSIVHD